METLMGILVLAAALGAVAALLRLAGWRQARRSEAVARQVALTDALDARLGAAVAPVVERAGRRWRVAVAVPFERPAVVATVLATVDETFAATRYELVLRRQASTVAAPGRERRAPLGRESLSWT